MHRCTEQSFFLCLCAVTKKKCRVIHTKVFSFEKNGPKSRREKLFQFTIFRLKVLVDCGTKEGLLNVSLLGSLTCSQIWLSLLADDDHYDHFARIKEYSVNFVKIQIFKETGQI